MSKPPNFWEVFAQALELSATIRSWRAFFPWFLILCIATPLALVYAGNWLFGIKIADDGAITILSSVAVAAGFFGSVSIATLGQVQRMVSEYPFSSFLKEEKLFDKFLFWPQYTLLFQIGLLLTSVIAAVSVRVIGDVSWNKYAIAFDVGLLIYVCTKTWHLIDLVRKLTWHYEDYNRQSKEYNDRGDK